MIDDNCYWDSVNVGCVFGGHTIWIRTFWGSPVYGICILTFG